jgi:NADH dehydrogenase/NADH:ubiquinone oxidoreductase subunit G
MSAPLLSRTINHRTLLVRPTATVLQACESAGVDVPRFCYHEGLSVAGNCRRCLVEVEKSPKPVVSCARPVSPNRVVYTDTPLVRKAREAVLEFLLLHHPLDCPICDQGGECDLQEEALAYGADRGRNRPSLFPVRNADFPHSPVGPLNAANPSSFFKRSVEDAETGPIVKRVRTRCIHCTRCVRFAAEVAGLEALGSFGRGELTEIGTYLPSLLHTELSGNLVDLCPVGALTSKPYAYRARPWELQRTESVDFFDARGTEIVLQTRGATSHSSQIASASADSSAFASSPSAVGAEALLRVLPRSSVASPALSNLHATAASDLPTSWLSDRSRYSFEGLRHGRLRSPVVLPSAETAATLPTRALTRSSSTALDWTALLPRFATPALRPDSIHSASPRFNVLIGGPVNLDRLLTTLLFTRQLGRPNPVVSPGRSLLPAQLTVDSPLAIGLNTLPCFTTLQGIFLLGTSLRFEASALATHLRRGQTRRPLSVATLAPFQSQRFRHNHIGSSLRALTAVIENRLPLTRRLAGNSFHLLLGADALRISPSAGSLLEGLTHQLAFRRRTKGRPTSAALASSNSSLGDRFSILHSSVTTLAAATLGIPASSLGGSYAYLNPVTQQDFDRSSTGVSPQARVATVQHVGPLSSATLPKVLSSVGNGLSLSRVSFFHFGTHRPAVTLTPRSAGSHLALPIASLYEQDGLLPTLAGAPARIRSHTRAVTPPTEARTLPSLWTALLARYGRSTLSRWAEGLAFAADEFPLSGSALERIVPPFALAPFAYARGTSISLRGVASILIPTGRENSLADSLVTHSPTRGAATLFLSSESSFSRTR